MDFLCALFTRNKTQPDPTISNTQDVEDAKQTNQMNFPRKFNNFTQELGNLVQYTLVN